MRCRRHSNASVGVNTLSSASTGVSSSARDLGQGGTMMAPGTAVDESRLEGFDVAQLADVVVGNHALIVVDAQVGVGRQLRAEALHALEVGGMARETASSS